jgi:arylsulfatase A-like enzyme
VHLDGYNFLPYLTGESTEAPRKEIFYFSDDGDLTALRYNDWKLIFMEQRAEATLQAWIEPFVPLRLPYIVNLRRDPYERALITSNTYYDWLTGPRLPAGTGAGLRGAVPGHFQAVSAAAESGELQS